MKVTWVFPEHRRCGISLYAQRYVDALREFVDIATVDSDDCSPPSRRALGVLNETDLVHVQYETSFFLKRGRDSYNQLCAGINRPLVVSLHEVYERFPGVYPREEIRGSGLARHIKEWIYDRRHPLLTAYRSHEARGFFARRLLVHYPFQKAILNGRGIPADAISVEHHPVPKLGQHGGADIDAGSGPRAALTLGTTGFINPNYNLDLLLATLEQLHIPWRFTWIGGLRREEDRSLLADIQNRIRQRGWDKEFTITGWVSDDEQARMLGDIDVFLALFSNRSSSGSLCVALGARQHIVASPLPLTCDLNADKQLMLIADGEPRDIAEKIRRLAADTALRQRLGKNISEYVANHTYPAAARRLAALYEREYRL